MNTLKHDTDSKCSVTINDNENDNVTSVPGSWVVQKTRVGRVSVPTLGERSGRPGI